MGMFLAKTTVNRGLVVFQKTPETAQGGFTLDNTGLTVGDTLLAGSVMGYDESTRKARLVKTATMQASATNTATTYQVLKGHKLIVGEVVGVVKGGKAFAITAIDTSNAAYDVITVGTTLAVTMAVGDVLFQSTSATGATAAAFIVTPKGLLFEDVDVYAHASVSVVVRGTVYARRAPGATAEMIAALPLIIFSQSY